ncbi:hypothetical protein NP233_g12191 [Leucocoprinus birnbaumii]|uniref:C2H2-type domain-containing protein n=1 Tax=Leucocoprinus birnbaumii TaxID=56174 RepID=A0AAD5YKN2_9AGAR|nr:hypothetical protein NP233_g12191 [Leucocoprinus birnbaumii]
MGKNSSPNPILQQEFPEPILGALELMLQTGARDWSVGITAALKEDHTGETSREFNVGEHWSKEHMQRLKSVFAPTTKDQAGNAPAEEVAIDFHSDPYLKDLFEKDSEAVQLVEDALEPEEQCEVIGERLSQLEESKEAQHLPQENEVVLDPSAVELPPVGDESSMDADESGDGSDRRDNAMEVDNDGGDAGAEPEAQDVEMGSEKIEEKEKEAMDQEALDERAQGVAPEPRSAQVELSPTLDLNLGTWRLSYNPEHKLIICQRCQSGVFYYLLHKHLTDPMQGQSVRYSDGTKVNNMIAHGVPLPTSNDFYHTLDKRLRDMNVVVDDLKGRTPDMTKKNEWPKYRIPLGVPVRPIEGMEVFVGRICPVKGCNHGFQSTGSMRDHLENKHGGMKMADFKVHPNRSPLKPLQRFIELNTWCSFFEVLGPLPTPQQNPNSAKPPQRLPSKPSASGSSTAGNKDNKLDESVDDFCKGHRSRQKDGTDASPGKVIHPFLTNQGIFDFLEGRPMKAIFALSRPPTNHPWVKRLNELRSLTFAVDMKALLSLHEGITYRVSTPTKYPPRKEIAPLTSKSALYSYWHCVVSLVWALICGYMLPHATANENGKVLFSFSAPQKNAIRRLVGELKSDRFDSPRAADALYQLLYSVYFPSLAEYEARAACNRWNDPLAVYLACQWIGKDGRYLPVWPITCMLAQVQYSMRLAALRLVWGDLFPQSAFQPDEAARISAAKHSPLPLPLALDHLHISSDRDRILHPIIPPEPAPQVTRLRRSAILDEEAPGAGLQWAPEAVIDPTLGQARSLEGLACAHQDLETTGHSPRIPGTVNVNEITGSEGRQSRFESVFVPFCKKYLYQGCLAPYNRVRRWMTKLSAIAFHSVRPPQMELLDGDIIKLADGTLISWDELADAVQTSVIQLHHYILERVLMGISPEELGVSNDFCALSQESDLETIGGGVFGAILEAGVKRGTPARKLFEHLIKIGELGDNVTLPGKTELNINSEKARDWCERGNKVWHHFLYPLFHISSGPPGRAPEDASTQISATRGSRGHFSFESIPDLLTCPTETTKGSKSRKAHPDEYAGVITTNYNKTGILTGMETVAMKFLPYCISESINVMISAVRPLEELLTIRYLVGEDFQDQVAENYSTYLFVEKGVPWSPKYMHSSLRQWFNVNLHKDITFQQFRHISILFNRHHYRKLRASEDALTDAKVKEKTAEELTGHSESLGRSHYGRTHKQDGPFAEYGLLEN